MPAGLAGYSLPTVAALAVGITAVALASSSRGPPYEALQVIAQAGSARVLGQGPCTRQPWAAVCVGLQAGLGWGLAKGKAGAGDLAGIQVSSEAGAVFELASQCC